MSSCLSASLCSVCQATTCSRHFTSSATKLTSQPLMVRSIPVPVLYSWVLRPFSIRTPQLSDIKLSPPVVEAHFVRESQGNVAPSYPRHGAQDSPSMPSSRLSFHALQAEWGATFVLEVVYLNPSVFLFARLPCIFVCLSLLNRFASCNFRI